MWQHPNGQTAPLQITFVYITHSSNSEQVNFLDEKISLVSMDYFVNDEAFSIQVKFNLIAEWINNAGLAHHIELINFHVHIAW